RRRRRAYGKEVQTVAPSPAGASFIFDTTPRRIPEASAKKPSATEICGPHNRFIYPALAQIDESFRRPNYYNYAERANMTDIVATDRITHWSRCQSRRYAVAPAGPPQ